jgi:hypothetical protein
MLSSQIPFKRAFYYHRIPENRRSRKNMGRVNASIRRMATVVSVRIAVSETRSRVCSGKWGGGYDLGMSTEGGETG